MNMLLKPTASQIQQTHTNSHSEHNNDSKQINEVIQPPHVSFSFLHYSFLVIYPISSTCCVVCACVYFVCGGWVLKIYAQSTVMNPFHMFSSLNTSTRASLLNNAKNAQKVCNYIKPSEVKCGGTSAAQRA